MERTVAKCLLEIGSVHFGFDERFYASNGMRIPLRCDNRLILAYPRVRKALAKWLSTVIKEKYPEVEMIVGTAVAGLSLAVLLSEQLELPMGYVYDVEKEKKYAKTTEAFFGNGTKVVVIDDVICTASTVLKAVDYLQERGCSILGILSVFSFELEKTNELLNDKQLKHYSLTSFNVLLTVGLQTGRITYNEYQKGQAFIAAPSKQTWANLVFD